jgi:hypothetical protein
VCILLLLSSQANAAGNDCPANVPSDVQQLILPVLQALRSVMDSGDWFAPEYEAAFDRLLKARGDSAVEARVALMDYYVGEELVCASALDGQAARELIWRYESCDMFALGSPVSRDHSLPLRGYTLKLIDSGKAMQSCTDSN